MYAARFENNLGLEPYQYEPRRAVPSVDSDSDSHISSESEEEVDFGDWRIFNILGISDCNWFYQSFQKAQKQKRFMW